jgi:hypothetical protein
MVAAGISRLNDGTQRVWWTSFSWFFICCFSSFLSFLLKSCIVSYQACSVRV